MSKVKYRVREYNPSTQNQGSHSFFAEVLINNEIDNVELANKIAARTGFKSYECQAVIAAIADVVFEETLEGNRIHLSDDKGSKFVSIYPRVQGSVSDLDIERETTAQHSEDESVAIRTTAQESDLTPSRLTWNLGSSVGIKYSKQFAIQKQATKVKFATVEVTDEEPGGSGDDSGDVPPSGGGGFGG